ncbi:MAG: hypothetical protein ACJ8DC_16410 [Gemmatimonadales bacterium]
MPVSQHPDPGEQRAVARLVPQLREVPVRQLPGKVRLTIPGRFFQSIERSWPVVYAQERTPSPLTPEVLQPVERLTAGAWPGAMVVPSMETGATDGLYLRNAGMPVYRISGVPLDADDIRAHGRDERIRVAAFYGGLDYTERLVPALASGESAAGRR